MLWVFVNTADWKLPFHYFYTTIPPASPREVAQRDNFSSQTSVLPNPLSCPASRILKIINADVELYNK